MRDPFPPSQRTIVHDYAADLDMPVAELIRRAVHRYIETDRGVVDLEKPEPISYEDCQFMLASFGREFGSRRKQRAVSLRMASEQLDIRVDVLQRFEHGRWVLTEAELERVRDWMRPA